MQSKWLVSQRRHTFILIRLLIENQHMSQYSRENLITPDIWLSLKTGSSTPTCTDTRAKKKNTKRGRTPLWRLLLPRFAFSPLCLMNTRPANKSKSDHSRWSWSCPTKLSDSRKGSTLENYLLLRHASGLNNSAMRASWKSHLLPLSVLSILGGSEPLPATLPYS